MSKLDYNKFSKELLEDLYLNQLLSKEQIAKTLNICSSSVDKYLTYYNITRDNKAVRITKYQNFYAVKSTCLKNEITEELLEQYYIIENHSYLETAEHFNISNYRLDKLLKEYNLNKDKHISSRQGLITKYNKAGNKETYQKNLLVKRNNTIIEKYGSTKNYYQQVREKTEQSNLDKYGYRYKITADTATNRSEKYIKVWHSEEESIKYLTSFSERPLVSDLALDLNCSVNCVRLWIEKYKLGQYIRIQKSHYEEDIIDFISTLGFICERNNRKILDGVELDIYVPEKQLAIEFNGNYWHDETKVGKHYHFDKSFACEQKGIRLIHIYQYQWEDLIKQNILKSIICNALGKNTNIIYARKCVLKELTKTGVVEFSINNSLHGHRNASIYLGLFYNNELVEVMTFGKAFFSRDNSIDYECIRSITKINTTVIGGMNKLFQYFIKTYNPQKILYYVDYNTHIGNSMSNLGFTFESYSKGGVVNIANCKEVREKYGNVFSRKPMKNKEIQQYVNEGKVLSIYDAGVKRYIWKNM